MEGTKTKFILVALVVIVIVTTSIGFYLIKDAGVEGITALEGKIIADDIAQNWNSNATLIGIRITSSMSGDGHFFGWSFKYIDTPSILSTTQCIDIIINYDNISEVRYDALIADKQPLGTWNIDSDKAYEIAKDNSAIKGFLLHNPGLEQFSLSNSTGTPTWYLQWAYDAWIDDPHWARIEIDANTGEVLYVES